MIGSSSQIKRMYERVNSEFYGLPYEIFLLRAQESSDHRVRFRQLSEKVAG
jgi:hypothetical protein